MASRRVPLEATTTEVKKWGRFLLLACVIGAGGVRVWAARDSFWLDEIFTYYLAREMGSVWDVVTKIRVEHHILNTVYLYLLGDQPYWFWYRLLSILSGTAAVVVIAWGTRGRGLLESLTATWLVGMSYPLIFYSSEARGNAPAVFFAVAAFFLLESYWCRREAWKVWLLWATGVLGFLAHLSFLFVFLALVAWSVLRELRQGRRRAEAAVEVMKCHAVPGLFFLVLYFLYVRRTTSLGGPVYPLGEILTKTLCYAVGAPERGIGAAVGVLAATGGLACGLARLFRNQEEAGLFYLIVLLVAPAFVVALSGREYVYLRYFVVCFPFLYLLLARMLVSFYRQSAAGKAVFALALLLFSTGNLYRTSPLLSIGRGSYYEATLYLAANTPGPEIVVGSDHDFRNRMTLQFYSRHLPPGKRLVYVDFDHWPERWPDWVITHNADLTHQPKPSLNVKGQIYALDRSFRYFGIDGFHWFVYRKAESAGRKP